MLRRNIRLRREYLYRKSLEGKERLLYEKKRKIREALEEGKPIPTELRNEEVALRQEIDLEDAHTAVPRSTIDDEYANAANGDPKILITTSHNPSAPLTQFVKVTRHDIKDKKAIGTMPEAYPHLILDNFSTKLGQRTANILKYLFPVPKPDTKRIVTFANQSDYISFRHHIYEKRGGPKSIELKEIGPRFELRLYQIKLGTMDQDEAQTEWVIRPYMNTTKKRKFLGD
ncbi:UNVERIFIED_CONTAM: U3 small nucleolar ribonucleoprotein IMP4 [Sesamum latifolium]|uniref:U3 small nucleolar ribonucleoprotein IMP4 n=1 Tax=Sesamum latifolium TaxID=2727402 RepID=A0AAW2Y6M6_9LAMI